MHLLLQIIVLIVNAGFVVFVLNNSGLKGGVLRCFFSLLSLVFGFTLLLIAAALVGMNRVLIAY